MAASGRYAKGCRVGRERSLHLWCVKPAQEWGLGEAGGGGWGPVRKRGTKGEMLDKHASFSEEHGEEEINKLNGQEEVSDRSE